MSLTGCKVVSVGRFPFHRGRGETEVARNLLRRQAEALAFRELSDERRRVALENEEQEPVPKGVYVLRKIPRQIEKKSIVQLLSSLCRLSLSFFTNFTTKFRNWIVAKMEVSRENRTKLAKFLGFISIG